MTKEADVPTPETKVCPCGLATTDHSLVMVQRCIERFAPVPTPGASEAGERMLHEVSVASYRNAERNAETLIRECAQELREYGDRLHEEMELERAGAFHEAARIVTSYADKLAARRSRG